MVANNRIKSLWDDARTATSKPAPTRTTRTSTTASKPTTRALGPGERIVTLQPGECICRADCTPVHRSWVRLATVGLAVGWIALVVLVGYLLNG